MNSVRLSFYQFQNSAPQIWGTNDQNLSGSGLYLQSTDPSASIGWYHIATLPVDPTASINSNANKKGVQYHFDNSSSYIAYKVVFPNDQWTDDLVSGTWAIGLSKCYFYESAVSAINITDSELAFIEQAFEYDNAAL
jgi:hypothetical protein